MKYIENLLTKSFGIKDWPPTNSMKFHKSFVVGHKTNVVLLSSRDEIEWDRSKQTISGFHFTFYYKKSGMPETETKMRITGNKKQINSNRNVLITVRIQKDMLVRRNKKYDFTYRPNNLVRQHCQQINSSNSYHKVHKMTKYKSAKP